MSKDNHIFIVILLLLAIFVKPQHLYGAESVAGERIAISGSSATVSQWFAKIEQEKNIVLSYDPSSIDLSQVVKVESGELTVEELLAQVLDGYEVQLKFMPPRKLVIHAQKVRQYYVSGTVSEGFSAEKLLGAIVAADNAERCLPGPMTMDFSGCIFLPAVIHSKFRTWDSIRIAGN